MLIGKNGLINFAFPVTWCDEIGCGRTHPDMILSKFLTHVCFLRIKPDF